MFWSKKKKIEKYSVESCLEMFSECNQDAKARENNKILYQKIKEYYLNKEELDINIERITLNHKNGKFRGSGVTSDLQLFVVILTIFLNSIIQLVALIFQAEYGIIGLMAGSILSFYLLIIIAKDNTKSRTGEKEFVYNISLIILEDIEKEQTKMKENDENSEKLKWIEQNFITMKLVERNSINAKDEVVVTEIKRNEVGNRKKNKH